MRKIIFAIAACAAMFFTSCEDDTADIEINVTNNNGNGNQPNSVIEIGGTYNDDLVLNGPQENATYEITSPIIMEEGTTLTIAAGTTIKSSAGTNGYVAILQGATINAVGTPSNPIVFTSSAAVPTNGDWGGLVILGDAPINAGTSATSEVGGFNYGGTNPNGNSGTLRYVRFEYTGAAINSESEFNGVSFYAVGNQTTVDNIEVFEGSDDGVEFFGGTVNASNIILTNAHDDALDWTEGWNGTLTNVYIQHLTTDVNNAIEADSNEDNNAAEPFSNPTINNLTIIGTGSQNEKEAIRLRRGTKVTINNAWIQGYQEGIDIDDAQTASHAMNDELNINQITFVDVPVRLKTDDLTNEVTEDMVFSSLGLGERNSVESWGNGWSTVGGATTGAPVELAGTYTTDLTLNASNSYTLSGALVMEQGTTLTIPAGVTVRCDAGGVGVYVAIKQGATIMAEGTSTNPIVFTSNAPTPSAGDWGGWVVIGNASINSGSSATTEVGGFNYGGNQDNDDSGVIKYVRLEYTGAAINSESEFNGFSFYAVGDQTVVENIQAHEGADDGVEFFGGTVNASNIVVTHSQDDSLDWTEGWRGTVDNIYILQGETHDKAIEADGNEDDNSLTPYSSPTINNITAIGFGGSEAFRIRRGTQVNMNNVYLSNYSEGFDIDDALTVDWVQQGATSITDVSFDNVSTYLVSDNGTNGQPATEAQMFTGIGNGSMLDVSAWNTWAIGL